MQSFLGFFVKKDRTFTINFRELATGGVLQTFASEKRGVLGPCGPRFRHTWSDLQTVSVSHGLPRRKKGSVWQWRSQPKNFGGGEMFDFRRITLFCLENRLSKHKMTIFSKNFGRYGPFRPLCLRLCSLVNITCTLLFGGRGTSR